MDTNLSSLQLKTICNMFGVVLLLLFGTSKCSCPVKTTDINVKSGLRQLNLTFVELTVSSSLLCAKQCLLRSICHSLNYNKVTRLCELNIVPLDSSNILTPYENFIHIPDQSLNNLISTKLAGSCANHTCPEFTVCAPNGDGFTCLLNVDAKKLCSQSPPPIPYTSVSSSGNEAGNTAIYICNSEYLSGTTNISCRANGEWTLATVQCKVECSSEPPNIPNTVANYTSNLVQSEAVYSCTSGYLYRSGSTLSVCQNDGSWSNNITIVCTVPVICPESSLPEVFGTNRNYTSITEGSVVMYDCKETYIYYSGDSQVECQGNRQWTTTELLCLPTQCYHETESQTFIYQGNVMESNTGTTCLRFDHVESTYDTIDLFPYDATMDAIGNKCRPTNKDGVIYKPWCYVEFVDLIVSTFRDWEFCDIPAC